MKWDELEYLRVVTGGRQARHLHPLCFVFLIPCFRVRHRETDLSLWVISCHTAETKGQCLLFQEKKRATFLLFSGALGYCHVDYVQM